MGKSVRNERKVKPGGRLGRLTGLVTCSALAAGVLILPPASASAVEIVPAPALTFIEDLFSWSKYSVRVGPGVLYSPDYEGSSNYKLRLVPAIDLRWKNVAYFHDKSLRINLLKLPWMRVGPILTYSPGRKESDNPNLQGLGNVGKGLEVGGFGESVVRPFAVRFDIQKEVAGGYGGVTSHVEMGFMLHKDEKLSVVAGSRISFASKNYMSSFFGITPAQSAASGIPVFNAGAGVKDAGVGLLSNYLINDSWSAGNVVGCSRLLGDAAQSPLVHDRGSKNQCLVYFRLAYQL
jgi:outer membrane scaffolding protein for murein synthesis (MipA/OmpV family)